MRQGKPNAKIGAVRIAAIAFLAAAGGSYAEEIAAPPDSSTSKFASPGAWGPIPARSDSTSAVLGTTPTPVWAKIVDAPYLVATYPIHLAGRVVEESLRFSGRIGLSRAVGRIFARRTLPPYTSVGLRGGGEDGIGGTIAVAFPALPGHGNTIRLRADATTGGDRGASAGGIWGRPSTGQLEVGGGYRVRANMHFYGLGPDTKERDESIFLEETTFGGASLKKTLGAGFSAKGAAFWSGVGARGTHRDHDPALGEVFEGFLPSGFHERSEGATVSLELEHDDAPEATRPERGGLRRVLVANFRDTAGDDLRFWTWRAEAQQFVPLWFSKRALALRAFATKIEPEGNADVPFQRLFTNDEPDLIRGYADLRYRDLGLASATAEYRWPIWALESGHGVGVDAYVFTDAGQVFHELGDIGDDLATSWGGGLRMGSAERFMGRLEFAQSEEGYLIRVRFDQVFQYDKGGFLRGRHPVPDR